MKLPFWNLFLSVVLLSSISCSRESDFPKLIFTPIDVPSDQGGEPNLTRDQEKNIYLSWLEYSDSGKVQFQYSILEGQSWSTPILIAQGDDWFVNWADFPSLAIYNSGEMAAHWLQMRGEGTYEYDVHISQSKDGINWNQPFIPHRDSIAAEHGFVSMHPIGQNEVIATWLDGRNTVGTELTKDNHGHQGSMSLRTATFNPEGTLTKEVELDLRICDCCQTDLALTPDGPIIAYRDRSNDEIRDISVVRQIGDKWMEPKSVFNDEWEIAGCPVNGPTIEANDSYVVVAWFTAAHGIPKVQISFSEDKGANFDLPIRVDDGDPIGRVDVKWWSDDVAFVTWLENGDDSGSINGKFIKADGTSSNSFELVNTDIGRRSGFPVLENSEDGFLLTWTHVEGAKTWVKTGLIEIM